MHIVDQRYWCCVPEIKLSSCRVAIDIDIAVVDAVDDADAEDVNVDVDFDGDVDGQRWR